MHYPQFLMSLMRISGIPESPRFALARLDFTTKIPLTLMSEHRESLQGWTTNAVRTPTLREPRGEGVVAVTGLKKH